MTRSESDHRASPDGLPASAASDALERFEAVIERRDGRPDRCAIVPRRTEGGLGGSWIAAEAGSFVALEAVR